MYLQLLDKQKGCCAICGLHELEHNGKLHVDHNHETGKVRGLLCTRCNTALGKFKESPTILESAVKYLERWKNVNKFSEG